RSRQGRRGGGGNRACGRCDRHRGLGRGCALVRARRTPLQLVRRTGDAHPLLRRLRGGEVRRIVCIALCLAIGGCGFGAGAPRGSSGAQLRVTRDFGRTSLASAATKTVRESDTVMRLLQAHAKTTTRYG